MSGLPGSSPGAQAASAARSVRVGSTAPTARESIIEIYRGGVRTLISY